MNAESATLRRVGVGFAAAAMLLTSACAAGQLAQTANEKATHDGSDATVGDIDLRGIALATPTGSSSYPKGSAILLRVVIVNNGTRTDTLTSVTSSAVSGWGTYPLAQASSVLGAGAASSPAPAASSPGSSSPAAGSSSAPTSPAGATPTSAGPTASSSAAPQGSQSVPIPAGESQNFGVPSSKNALLLLNTTSALSPGSSISVTFTFARAGTVSVPVPVQLTGTAGTATIPAPSGAATG